MKINRNPPRIPMSEPGKSDTPPRPSPGKGKKSASQPSQDVASKVAEKVSSELKGRHARLGIEQEWRSLRKKEPGIAGKLDELLGDFQKRAAKLGEMSSDQLTASFLRLNVMDPGESPEIHSDISKMAESLREAAAATFSVRHKVPEIFETFKTGSAEMSADLARLETKRAEIQEAVADSAIDDAKAGYEDAKEQFKLALRVLSEHMERQSQVIQKITS